MYTVQFDEVTLEVAVECYNLDHSVEDNNSDDNKLSWVIKHDRIESVMVMQLICSSRNCTLDIVVVIITGAM